MKLMFHKQIILISESIILSLGN